MGLPAAREGTTGSQRVGGNDGTIEARSAPLHGRRHGHRRHDGAEGRGRAQEVVGEEEERGVRLREPCLLGRSLDELDVGPARVRDPPIRRLATPSIPPLWSTSTTRPSRPTPAARRS